MRLSGVFVCCALIRDVAPPGFYGWVDLERDYWGVFVHSWAVDTINMFWICLCVNVVFSLAVGVAFVPPWRDAVLGAAAEARRCVAVYWVIVFFKQRRQHGRARVAPAPPE